MIVGIGTKRVACWEIAFCCSHIRFTDCSVWNRNAHFNWWRQLKLWNDNVMRSSITYAICRNSSSTDYSLRTSAILFTRYPQWFGHAHLSFMYPILNYCAIVLALHSWKTWSSLISFHFYILKVQRGRWQLWQQTLWSVRDTTAALWRKTDSGASSSSRNWSRQRDTCFRG